MDRDVKERVRLCRVDKGMAQREEILEEDRLRAQLYGLLARTLVRAPDEEMLAALRALEGNESELGVALNGLALAAGSATAAGSVRRIDYLPAKDGLRLPT